MRKDIVKTVKIVNQDGSVSEMSNMYAENRHYVHVKAQETIEALGGMDIMPKHSDAYADADMSAYLSYHLDSLIIQAHMSTRHYVVATS